MRTLVLLGATIDLATGTISGDRPGRLTTRELTLLAYLAARPGETVSRSALLTDAFGYSNAAVSRAVDKTMNTLREKIEIDPAAPDHLITAVGVGYRFEPGLQPTTAAAAGHLPSELDRFIGRQQPLEDLRAMLESPGLVVLLGPGGVGKTRLALALARHSESARFADLSGARSREDLLSAVGASLGVPLIVAKLPPDTQLGHALAALRGAVVLLDNFEHLAEFADLLELWCRLAPEIRLLVTSRRTLGLASERVLRLDPMPAEEGAALVICRAAQRGFALPNDGDLAALVRGLDGLPLALELAAARLGIFGVRDLLSRLDERLSLLHSRDPRAQHRHATLAAMLHWSWSLLDGAEQTAMAELSVFAGDFAVDAAEAVLQPPPDGRETLDVIDALLDASLLQRRSTGGTVRLGMLETVRLYAADRLADLDPHARLRAQAAYVAHYVRLGEALRDKLGPEGAAKSRRLAREFDHLVAVCRCATTSGDASSALSALRSFSVLCAMRGPYALYGALARAVHEMPSLDARGVAEATWQLGRAIGHVDVAEAEILLQQSLAQALELGDEDLADRVRNILGGLMKNIGRRDDANILFERCTRSADPVIRAANRRQLAVMAYTSGAYETSLQLLADAESEARRAGDLLLAAIIQNNAVWAMIRLGRLDEALVILEECTRVFEAFDAKIGLLHSRGSLGQILAYREAWERAQPLFDEAIEGFRKIGDKPSLLSVVGEAGGLLCNKGRFHEALERLTEAETLARELRNLRAQGALGAAKAEALLGLGRTADALALVTESREILAPMGVTDVSLSVDLIYADTLCEVGRAEEAGPMLDEIERHLIALGHPETSQLRAEITRIRGKFR